MTAQRTGNDYVWGDGSPGWPQRLSILMAALGFAVPSCSSAADGTSADAPGPGGGEALAYHFDSRLLLGSSLGVANIERFNTTHAIEPGLYQVDIFVNGAFFSRRNIAFRSTNRGTVEPCVSNELLEQIGVRVPDTQFDDIRDEVMPESESFVEPEAAHDARARDAAPASDECTPPGERVPGVSARFDPARLRLDIDVAHALIKRAARGFVDPADLDPGNAMGYLNYDTNYYTASSAGTRTDSFYAGINAGINIGLWRLREQSALTYSRGFGGSVAHWNNIRTYAERPLLSWRSRLLIGENFTGGNLFSSIGYTGIHVESDDRMLPDSLRGYAPVINGVANTNARVVVSQNGNVIYETTVAPGPFSITDQPDQLPGRSDGSGIRRERTGQHVHGAVFGGTQFASARPVALPLHGRPGPADRGRASTVRRFHV